jgi:AcrR family transcriptional regulator
VGTEQTTRGEQRRAALVEAGIAQLAEHGWSGVTQRAVAGRAGANPGLVHYYFRGSAGLRRAVAEATCAQMIGGMFAELSRTADEGELFARLAAALHAVRNDPRGGRLITESLVATFDDPEIHRAVQAEFARARTTLADWFGDRHPDWSPVQARAAATLVVAAMDGLTIHVLLDPDLPTDGVSELLQTIADRIDTLHER